MHNLNSILSAARDALGNCGIDFAEDETPLDLDSLQFMNMILEFEEVFDIAIGDEYLFMERFGSFQSIINTLSEIIGVDE